MNSGTELKKFRNSIGGYHKDDVNAYIKEIDLQYSAKLAELQSAVAALTAEKESLLAEQENRQAEKEQLAEALRQKETLCCEKDAELAELQNRLQLKALELSAQAKVIEELRSEKSDAAARNTALQEELRQAVETADTLRQNLTAKEQEMLDAVAQATAQAEARAEKEIEKLQASLTEEEDSIGYKIRMYDQISGQIGDILLGANRNADEILENAHTEAEKLRMQTADEITRLQEASRKEVDMLRGQFSDTAQGMLADLSGELHNSMENCIKEISTCMAEVEYDTETVLQTMQKRCSEMNDRIQYFQSCVQDSIAAKLNALDQQYGQAKAGK